MPQLFPHLRNAASFRLKQVRMGNTTFFPSVIRIKEGESIRLYVDTSASHVITNGTWENGKLRLSQELSVPVVDNVRVKRECPQTIGPFHSVGRFEFCSAMQRGMNLTVHVSE